MTTRDRTADSASIEDRHYKTYRNHSDAVWDRNAVCAECDMSWPCDVALVVDEYKSCLSAISRDHVALLNQLHDEPEIIAMTEKISTQQYVESPMAEALLPLIERLRQEANPMHRAHNESREGC